MTVKPTTSDSLARACIFLSPTASSMSSISIHYNKVVTPFPRNSELEVSELIALFKVKELGIHIKFLQNGTWHNQYPHSFSQKFIVPTDERDVYLVGIPEEDPKYENNNMNIVPQSPSVESLEFLSGGPIAAGGASMMSSSLMLTPSWYTSPSAYPSTGYNSIVHQTAGHMSNIGTTGKRGNAANSMALFKNTMNKLGPKAVPPKRQKGYNGYSSSVCSNSR